MSQKDKPIYVLYRQFVQKPVFWGKEASGNRYFLMAAFVELL